MDVSERRVEPSVWRDTCVALVESGATMVDFLTAVDRPAEGRIDLVVHLVDVAGRVRHLVTTGVDRSDPVVESLVDRLPGVAWHEREVHEMFGVAFAGNPDLRPLLTTGPMVPPLRRTTPLPARQQAGWPGAFDPADRREPTPSGPPGQVHSPAPQAAAPRAAARPRARLRPPGLPLEWEDAGRAADAVADTAGDPPGATGGDPAGAPVGRPADTAGDPPGATGGDPAGAPVGRPADTAGDPPGAAGREPAGGLGRERAGAAADQEGSP